MYLFLSINVLYQLKLEKGDKLNCCLDNIATIGKWSKILKSVRLGRVKNITQIGLSDTLRNWCKRGGLARICCMLMWNGGNMPGYESLTPVTMKLNRSSKLVKKNRNKWCGLFRVAEHWTDGFKKVEK